MLGLPGIMETSIMSNSIEMAKDNFRKQAAIFCSFENAVHCVVSF